MWNVWEYGCTMEYILSSCAGDNTVLQINKDEQIYFTYNT